MKLLHKTLKKLFYTSSKWSIGVILNYHAHDILDKEISNVKWFSAKKSADFYADPFITLYFGRPVIFFEEWINKEHKGIISYIELDEVQSNKGNISHHALELPTHLSFPYIFEYDGHLYMVPENYQSETITIYEAGDAPDKWTENRILMNNFPGIDTIIFKYNELWWMFSTKYDFDIKSDNRYQLYIWFAETPFGEWQRHSLSPIQYSEPIARSAGAPFEHSGKLYRPTQDCRGRYGKQIIITEISKLTSSEFLEHPVNVISPLPPYMDALHTYSSISSISVIDGIRGRYSLLKPITYLRDKLNK